MDNQKASRPHRVKNNPPLPPVSNPLTKEDRKEFSENKYARRTTFIAKPTLGRAIKVETVGLGNLKVETFNGIQPDV